MKFTHIYQIPFTGLGLHGGYRGDQWLKNRIKIFKLYPLQSLLSQEGEKILWFQWRPEEESNPIVKEFIEFLNKIINLKHVHTFGGITFWDDKYEEEIAKSRLRNSLKVSLPKLEFINSDYVLLTIQPSDDMYLKDAQKEIQAKFRELLVGGDTKQSVGWKGGYIMNYATKEIAEYSTHGWKTDHVSTYHTDTIPPFFTISFSREEFLDPIKHYDHIGPYKSHEFIGDVTKYTELKGRGFIVGTHGENISTTFTHRYKGRTLAKEEAEKIFVDLGIYHSEPIRIRLSFRMMIRKMINVFPFSNSLKKLYYLLPGKYRII